MVGATAAGTSTTAITAITTWIAATDRGSLRQDDSCERNCLAAIQVNVGEPARGAALDDADIQEFAFRENSIEKDFGDAAVLPAPLCQPFGPEADRDRVPPATDI
jgi:hypothetical protein